MKISVKVDRDPETNETLAVYLRFKQGQVAKTVELCEDECYVDEDANGQLLGIEILGSGKLKLTFRGIRNRYVKKQPEIELMLKEAMETLRVNNVA